MDARSIFPRIKERNDILYLENRLMGESIEIPTDRIKKVKENFPDISITLKNNKMIRVDGKTLTTKVYSDFLKALRKHEVLNKAKDKDQNQSGLSTPRASPSPR